MNEAKAKLLGEKIIELLHLKVDKKSGYVKTALGDKSPQGLGYEIERICNQEVKMHE